MNRAGLIALAIAPLIAAGCGSADDNDGGRLNIREETDVKEWVRRITPVIAQVGQVDIRIADGDQVRQTMMHLERTRPPLVRHDQADREMREFHDALVQRVEALVALNERMARPIGLLTDTSQIEDLFNQMQVTENRVRNLAGTLSATLMADFQDDAAFQPELQGMVSAASQAFGGGLIGGGAHRRMPNPSGMRTMPPAMTP